MPSIILRILSLYNLLNAFFLHLVPKKLRIFLPTSWYHHPPSPEQFRIRKPCFSATKANCRPLRIAPIRMDADELKRVFQMFDRNGDGRITKKELNDSLENMGIFIPDKELEQMIARIDANGDGCVDMDEFGSLYATIMEGRNEDEDEEMREAFNVFDQNGDGFITVEELKSVMQSLGLKQGRTAEDCKNMIMKVDVDGDGRVNFNEFLQMMRGGGFDAFS